MSRRQITVRSLNYDRSLRRGWKAELIRHDGPLIELVGEFAFGVEHTDLGSIQRGTVSYEYYWLDRWYNVFRFHEPNGEFRNYYCNINQPPSFENDVLEYIDLDIDLVVDREYRIKVLDLEEFEKNIRLFSIPKDVCGSARGSVDELITAIEKRVFPFDRQSII